MQRVLVVRFSSLGDVVLSTVLLDAIRQRHPDAQIWWMTKRAFAPLLESDPRVHRVVALEPGQSLFEASHPLRAQRFDLVLDAHASLRSRALTILLPRTQLRRVGKDTAARIWRLRTGRTSTALQRRMVDRLLDLIEIEDRDLRPRLLVPEEDKAWAAAQMTGPRRWIAVAPAARHAPKQWPVERFADLMRRFQGEFTAPDAVPGVLVLAGPGEEALAEEVSAALEGPKLVMAGAQALKQLAALLERCDRLVCNDSGLLHMAEAVGTPVTAFFGPTSREWGYFPLDARSTVLERDDVACRPCSRNGARACRLPERICMTNTSVDTAHAALQRGWSS